MIQKFIMILSLLQFSLFAQETSEIIKKVEDNLNGKSAYMQFTMIVKTSRYERKMQMQSWGEGNEKSFIKVTYPKKDKGITFLKIDNQMWQYIPKIEKTIKIPSSMMLQSWMGSDFTNDDLAKESSIMDDYNHKLIDQNSTTFKIELLPKEDSAVVWGKIVMIVSKKYFLPQSTYYYDEDDLLIRTLHYQKFRQLSDRMYPTYWEMLPQSEDKKDHKTIVIVDEAEFDKEIDASYFTKRALKRYSK